MIFGYFKTNLNFNSISSINGQKKPERKVAKILSCNWPTYWAFENNCISTLWKPFKGTSSMNKVEHNDRYTFDLLAQAVEKWLYTTLHFKT